jgi:hypothetical protein
MMELVDIWGVKLPSSSCLTTVFEKQAKLLSKKNEHTKQPQQMEYFCQQSLRAINQLGNGFRVENFEGIIQFWAKQWQYSSCLCLGNYSEWKRSRWRNGFNNNCKSYQ